MNPFRSSECSSGKEIRIPSDTDHVWIQTESKTLFVRSCYNDIWALVENHYFRAKDIGHVLVTDGTADGFIITGTPGVGKSCFLDFCLHKLLGHGLTVLYFHGKTNSARIYKNDGTIQKYSIAENQEGALATEVDFILIDPPEGGDPNFLGGRTNLKKKKYILAISPDRNNCQSIRKDTSFIKLYMGTCPMTEAEEMRTACYNDDNDGVTPERLALRYDEFGGIPRYLFKRVVIIREQDTTLNEIRDNQKAALQDILVNPQRIDYLESSDPFKSLWTIYHMEPISTGDSDIDYMTYTIRPCCEKAATRIRDELMKKSVRELWSTFEGTREELGVLRGIRYEAYAHKKILSEGLEGTAIGLTSNGLSKATPKAIRISVSSKIDLPNNDLDQGLRTVVARARALTSGVYLLPHLPNYPVVDSFFVPPNANDSVLQLQMKAGRSRPLSTDKAIAIASVTGSTDLYFIVPDEITITKKLPGPADWHQYRVILRET